MLEKLRDIKGIVAVTDYSAYYLIVLCLIVLLIIAGLIYFFMKPTRRKKLSIKELELNKLKNIDFKNQKDVAYSFSLSARYFINEKNEKEFEEIVEKLEVYKYKKEVPLLDIQLKKEIKDFIGRLK